MKSFEVPIPKLCRLPIMANGKNQPGGSGSSLGKENKDKSGINWGEAIAKKLAATEKDRMEQAKRIAADIKRKAVVTAGNQDGGGPNVNETPDLLRNMCGILNRGFANLGLGMKDLKTSFDSQLNSLSDNLEQNFNELWGEFADLELANWEDDVMVDTEPQPPQPFRLDESVLSKDEEENGVQEMLINQPQAGTEGVQETPVNYFARLARSLRAPTDVGANLDSSLAELVNHIFQHPLSTEEMVRLKGSTLRPGNCGQLQVPPCRRPSGSRCQGS